jgi:2-isopropylmalate synthase
MPQALVLGKHSGRAAFKERLEHLGFHVNEDQLQKAFDTFKSLADEKKLVSDRDIESIVLKDAVPVEALFQIENVHVECGTDFMPTATVSILNKMGEKIRKTCNGTGPVDAIYNAVEELIGRKINLLDYVVHAVTEGMDALGEVTVRIKEDERVYTGRGADTDVMVASAQAFVSAINKMLYYQQ